MPELEISRIHDAYAADGECPICYVMNIAERTYVRSFRGARVMAPEVRVATNRSGFCPEHFERLYLGEGKLGLSLLVHTHLEEIGRTLLTRMERAGAASGPGRLLRRRGRRAAASGGLVAELRELVGRCYICDMLATDRDRYCYTVLYLWQRDPGFPERLRSSRGFCLAHYADILDTASRMLSAADEEKWLRETAPLMTASVRRLTEQVLAFSRSYHHDEGRAKPGSEVRTALSRAIQKITGRMLRLEAGDAAAAGEEEDQDRLTPPDVRTGPDRAGGSASRA